ncbi:MAG: acyloxyacyl hydrolase [Muribaculaceae bacterium]|nr:acyloxyacyl hydrolase [Muribaculaceae bacterium]
MRRKILIIMFMIAVCISASASDSIGWRQYLGLDVRPSYAFSSYHDDILKSMVDAANAKKTTFATSLHLKYGFTFSPLSPYGRYFPASWQGLGASVNFLGNSKGIGTPISIYAFQGAPIFRFSNRLSLYYEWNFGASFGWKRCDGYTAYSNLVVGSNVNAYINLGTGIQWKINDEYALSAGIDLTHFSNGNTSFPNPGVNLAGIKVGVSKSIGQPHKHSDNSQNFRNDSVKFKRSWGFDVTLYGAWRKRVYRGGEEPILLNGHFGVIGMDIAPMYKISNIFRAGASVDVQWDESTDLKRHYASGNTADDILFYRPGVFDQVCLGISGRAELVMPIFSVNVGIGYNVIGPEETRATYELANLKVRISKHFFLNIGYQLLNFQKQNNLMLGFGYTFR